MAKLRLSKQSLSKEREQLKLYRRLLPSLDLKRRQLTLEQEKARRAVQAAHEAAGEFEGRIGAELPMVADERLDVAGLLAVRDIALVEENVVGVRLPALETVTYDEKPYSLLARPVWVDVAIERMKQAIELRVRARIAEQRVTALDKAVRRITQRVNLFDRVLIPSAKSNIKRIQIYLGDLDRDAVVRSKLAKAKQRPAAGEPRAEARP